MVPPHSHMFVVILEYADARARRIRRRVPAHSNINNAISRTCPPAMPPSPHALQNFFSYNAGPVHVISLASFYDGGFGASSRMTVFLKADLAAIDRSVTPWVIVQGRSS